MAFSLKRTSRVNKRKSLLILLLKALCLTYGSYLFFNNVFPFLFSLLHVCKIIISTLQTLPRRRSVLYERKRDLSQKVWFQLQFPSTLIGFGFLEIKALFFSHNSFIIRAYKNVQYDAIFILE